MVTERAKEFIHARALKSSSLVTHPINCISVPSDARAVKLAHFKAKIATPLTSLRIYRRSVVHSSAISNPNTRDVHTPFWTKSQNKFSHLQNLVPSTSDQVSQSHPNTEQVDARILSPTLSFIDKRETTVERWRSRKRFGDEHYDAPNKKSRVTENGSNPPSQGEIAFNPGHLARLKLHIRDPRFRSPEFQAAQKMRSWVQVLTTPTADTPGTTLLLHFDTKRYLFGSLAEGTQRAAVQMGARLLKVNEAFVTGRTEWSNVGGLIGMILTLAEVNSNSREASQDEARKRGVRKAQRKGVEEQSAVDEMIRQEIAALPSSKLQLVGPPNLNHVLATARRFVFRKGMPLDIHEVGGALHDDPNIRGKNFEEPDWADENIKVWAFPLKSGKQQQQNGIDLEQLKQDLLAKKAVVGEMFNSSWRLDTLYPTRLADVHLPATIFIRNKETHRIEQYSGPLPTSDEPVASNYDPNLQVLVRKPWPGALIQSLPPVEQTMDSVCYIVKGHMQRGKFDAAAARRLNVKPGPDFGRLSNGKSVQNQDGVTISPEQVMEPSRPGGGLAILNLPDPSYIGSLLQCRELKDRALMAGVSAVFWILGPDVFHDSRLKDMIIGELGDLKHIVSAAGVCANYLTMDGAAKATMKMRQVDPDRFTAPQHSNVPTKDISALGKSVFRAERGQAIQLEPSVEVLTKDVPTRLDVDAEGSLAITEETSHVAIDVRNKIASENGQLTAWSSSLPDPKTEIITLGTGSAQPSKYRNVSSTLVRVPGWGAILLDCGENTIGQLKRVFTDEELREVFRSLRCIFISHMHADHHLGLASVLRTWYLEVHDGKPSPPQEDTEKADPSQKRLSVIAEPAMCSWLQEYSEIEDIGLSRVNNLLLTLNKLKGDSTSHLKRFSHIGDKSNQALIDPTQIGLKDLQAAKVQHCQGARAYSITLPSGFKLSYSGDCRPSQAFAEIGKGSTVCIHEATFDDELSGDALAKKHSTTSEALRVAQAMGARTCVLTHFSQRYQKLPVLEYADLSNDDAAENQLPPDAVDADNYDEGDGEIETYPDQPSAGNVDAEIHGGGNGPGPNNNNTNTTSSTGLIDSSGPSTAELELPYNATKAIQKRGPADSGTAVGESLRFKLTTDMRVCSAFDCMRVKVGEIAHAQYFIPALLKLFTEEERLKEEEKAKITAAEEEAKRAKSAKGKGSKQKN